MKKTRLVLIVEPQEFRNLLANGSGLFHSQILGPYITATLHHAAIDVSTSTILQTLGIDAKVEQFEEADVVESPRP